MNQPLLQLDTAPPHTLADEVALHAELASFNDFGGDTIIDTWHGEGLELPVYINEFWTARQRQGNPLHEISYRACFKPQLPRFFIERLSAPGEVVFDPFMGRGTTAIEAALAGRIPWGNDASPLAARLTAPRLDPPSAHDIEKRLKHIRTLCTAKPVLDTVDDELLVFYHENTLRDLSVLRKYLIEREQSGELDAVDAWIRLVATNRLTGHSPGFFSVYTLPPNQAVTVERQRKLNEKRGLTPPFRDVFRLILKKSGQLIKDLRDEDYAALADARRGARFSTASADGIAARFAPQSVALVVTSPPFLDVVQYAQDNWLRCWFNGLDARGVKLWNCRKIEDWTARMMAAMEQLRQLLQPGGWIAFEVGEVRQGSVKLEDYVVRAGRSAGLEPVLILINQQDFTKTANCWGVANNSRGTNTNRIVLLRKSSGDRHLTTA